MRETLADPGSQTVSPQTLVPQSDCTESGQIELEVRELFQTAALMLGDEAAALDVVEQTVAAVEMDPCADAAAARAGYARELVDRALLRVADRYPDQMQPAAAADLGGCVETDDLSAAGISRTQLEQLLAGSSRQRMRQWLEGLAPVERVVFVLRAVLGRSGADSASLLSQSTGAAWNEASIGGAYRSALCSLASALVHSAAH